MANNSSTITYIRTEINKVKKELAKYSTKEEMNIFEKKMKYIRAGLKKIHKKYATHDDVSKSVKEMIDFVLSTNNQTKSDIRTEMQDMKKELKVDIVQFKDEVLSEIIKLRKDITVVIGYRDTIEDHENRIQKLEKKPSAN